MESLHLLFQCVQPSSCLWQLADYRYNLGVLILEHKKCSPQIEELEEALQSTRDELQKEGRSLQLALDDVTRREDGLRASLKAERSVIAEVCTAAAFPTSLFLLWLLSRLLFVVAFGSSCNLPAVER